MINYWQVDWQNTWDDYLRLGQGTAFKFNFIFLFLIVFIECV